MKSHTGKLSIANYPESRRGVLHTGYFVPRHAGIGVCAFGKLLGRLRRPPSLKGAFDALLLTNIYYVECVHTHIYIYVYIYREREIDIFVSGAYLT